ncbi:MAG: hypothetical protein M1514_02205 [Patescibacteria group bacterium]|nr:hypothetical protein [Patescibacteria group bacterium]
MGIKPLLYPGTPQAMTQIITDQPEAVINLVGSVRGNEYLASTIPGILEFLGLPYTGAGILGESMAYNKFMVKKLLESNGIPVPHIQLFNSPNDPIDPTMHFPFISKLNEIHGAVEINKNAVSENEKHLRERLKFLISTYKQPVLVEEFIAGREITAILLEGLNTKVYFGEKVFTKPKEKFVFATFEDQWTENEEEAFHYQKYSDPLLQEFVKKAFEVTKMSDYGKFDIRMDASGRYYFVDANSNPAFGPKEAECAIANILDLYGVSFFDILKRLLLNTVRDSEGRKLLPIVDNGDEEK